MAKPTKAQLQAQYQQQLEKAGVPQYLVQKSSEILKGQQDPSNIRLLLSERAVLAATVRWLN